MWAISWDEARSIVGLKIPLEDEKRRARKLAPLLGVKAALPAVEFGSSTVSGSYDSLHSVSWGSDIPFQFL